jgi:hypothetical protein
LEIKKNDREAHWFSASRLISREGPWFESMCLHEKPLNERLFLCIKPNGKI